jgi:hypothetical protein
VTDDAKKKDIATALGTPTSTTVEPTPEATLESAESGAVPANEDSEMTPVEDASVTLPVAMPEAATNDSPAEDLMDSTADGGAPVAEAAPLDTMVDETPG